jgi:glutamine amidotransferase-like uncharacterized protein
MLTKQNTFQKLRIACLSYQGLSAYGLEPTMAQMFPEAEILTVYPQHLRAHVLKNYDLLVMPGIVGEDSPYPEILPKFKAEQVVSCMEESGLVLWTSCAATYYCFEKMLYLKRNGQMKMMNGLGLIKGLAEGPAYQNVTRQSFEHSAHHDRVLAELSLADSDQIFRALDINGPALYPHSESLVDSFLRYSNIPGQPVAGFTKKIGQGLILGLSSHPEFALNHELLPQNFKLHEPSRLSFLTHIRDKLVTHWVHTGKLSVQPSFNLLKTVHA